MSTIEEEEGFIEYGRHMHRRQDQVQGWSWRHGTDLHKYSKDYHIVIKTDKGEERKLNLSEYCKNWFYLFP
jgi:hypothetical protein